MQLIGSVYSLTTTTIELCDDIQIGSRVYGSYTNLKNNSSSIIELVKESLSKKCQDNSDDDDINTLVTNLTQKLTVRADNFLALLNKISLAGTKNDIETQLTSFESGQSGFNANAQATKDKMTTECDEDYTNECKASDFVADQKTKTKGPNRKTITCRVFYENPNIPRAGDINELKKLLTETNKARRLVKNSTSIPLDPTKKRTFAVAKINNFDFIYDMNTTIPIVDKSGNKLTNFADELPISKNRFFVDFNLIPAMSFNQTHAEINILEEVARRFCTPKTVISTDSFTTRKGKIKNYNIYQCNPAKIDYFTDRATCGYCSSTIRNFISNATRGIILTPKNFDFKSGNQYGIFYSGETIIAQDINFFNSLKIK